MYQNGVPLAGMSHYILCHQLDTNASIKISDYNVKHGTEESL